MPSGERPRSAMSLFGASAGASGAAGRSKTKQQKQQQQQQQQQCKQTSSDGIVCNDDNGQAQQQRQRQQQQEQQSPSSSGGWLKKTLIGRTPSLPSSLGKRKQSFLKRFQGRKISAPAFPALRQLHGTRQNTPPPPPPPVAQHQLDSLEGPYSQEATPPPSSLEYYQDTPPSSLSCSGTPHFVSRHRHFSQGQHGAPYGLECSSQPLSIDTVRASAYGQAHLEDDSMATPSSSLVGGGNTPYDLGRQHYQESPPIFFEVGGAVDGDNSSDPAKRQASSNSLLALPVVQVQSLEEALVFIDELKQKFRSQGQQIISYRRKVRQQRGELSDLREGHRLQLEEISAQLLRFESSLRGKEKQLQETLTRKDQVILKQQRVIKRLLKKCYGRDFCISMRAAETDIDLGSVVDPTRNSSIAQQDAAAGRGVQKADSETQNDSDSAIMLEDHLTEVSLMVPNYPSSSNSNSLLLNNPKVSSSDSTNGDIKVLRSVSDVVKAKQQQQYCTADPAAGNNGSNGKPLSGRKTKEERRISNRQKLLSLKRHSGFLKRPEILETVYSVEEDGENAQQQQQQNSTQQQQQPSTESGKGSGSSTEGRAEVHPSQASKKLSQMSTDSPPPSGTGSRRGSSVQLTGFRYRLDSDQLTCGSSDVDYSTDDDSTRIFYSETTSCTSCSQPCSRRSSYGTGICSLPCSRRSSYGQGCQCAQCNQCMMMGSLTGSRRSSYGSQSNLHTNSSDADGGPSSAAEHQVQTTYNRVMLNHRAVTKPRDVKFKRINKAKSRSLEELRGKLKWTPPEPSNPARPPEGGVSSSSTTASSQAQSPMTNSKGVLLIGGSSPFRGIALRNRCGKRVLKQCASLDQSDA